MDSPHGKAHLSDADRSSVLKPKLNSQIRLICVLVVIAVFVTLDFLDLGLLDNNSATSMSQRSPPGYEVQLSGESDRVEGTGLDFVEPGSSSEAEGIPVDTRQLAAEEHEDSGESNEEGDKPVVNGEGTKVNGERDFEPKEEMSPVAESPGSTLPGQWRGAIWKPEIAQWFQACGGESEPIEIDEEVYGKRCPGDCQGNGVCNYELGECRCRHGFDGPDCSHALNYTCDYQPLYLNGPAVRWVVSNCKGYCDPRTARCVCGPDSKYPHRPILDPCATERTNEGVVWTNKSHSQLHDPVSGWCNVDPGEVREGKVAPQLTCGCSIDGYSGQLCDEVTRAYCVGGCNNNGECLSGYCACKNGWYGIDCSIPSTFTTLDNNLPPWLPQPPGSDQPQASRRLLADKTSQSGAGPPYVDKPHDGSRQLLADGDEVKVVRKVERRRPLIYVYDLPGDYNFHHYEGNMEGGTAQLNQRVPLLSEGKGHTSQTPRGGEEDDFRSVELTSPR